MFADPIIDLIDPQGKYIKHRFYQDSMKASSDGGPLIKDMSVIDNLIH